MITPFACEDSEAQRSPEEKSIYESDAVMNKLSDIPGLTAEEESHLVGRTLNTRLTEVDEILEVSATAILLKRRIKYFNGDGNMDYRNAILKVFKKLLDHESLDAVSEPAIEGCLYQARPKCHD
jgi:hypothetical protein